ncbi:TRAP transporter small permease subunit [Azospirillum thermophilum]|uniref:TRAP transporter small permease protein n=1 Tax=Azospirillum thermophilum TaxID=2202148 RepID=A0A2S2CW62_9PROT|nr:TRAP transporter small permease [Azospirillum thermophilum]AWK88764.1 C4-dicarboxylate ABC transporter permease [Azospirillum thermophilum]
METQHDGGAAPPGQPTDRLSAVIAWIGRYLCILFIVSTAVSVYEIVMRYLFNSPTVWVHETTTTLTAICFAFGGAYCLATDKHIRVVLIYDHVGPRVRRWMDIVISLVGAGVCGLMAYASWGMAWKSLFTPSGAFRIETSGSAWNPPSPALLKPFLFLILVVMTLQFLLQMWRHIRRPPGDVHHGQPGAGVYEDA